MWNKIILNFFINFLAASVFMPRPLRARIYRCFMQGIGTKGILSGCTFGGLDVKIGRQTFINRGCSIGANVEIEEQVALACRVQILSTTHLLDNEYRRSGTLISKKTIIGKGCWIGAGVIILPGVTISEGCIIGAGTVVTKDCEANGLYVGTPGRRIEELYSLVDRGK